MRRFYRYLLSIVMMIFALFFLSQFSETVEADTTTTAKIEDVKAEGNFYQATINFQLSSEGTQMILYSPDYDNLDLKLLEDELGSTNVIADSSKKQVIVNLKDKLDENNTGSFIVDMKKATPDDLYVRDINNNNLAGENLATTTPLNIEENDSNTLTVNNALSENPITVNKASLLRSAAVPTAVTTPVIHVDDFTIDKFDQPHTFTGTWQSPSNSISIYYQFNSSANNKWTYLGTFYGTAGAVNTFTGQIPESITKEITAGKRTLFFADSQTPKTTSYASVTVPQYADSMKMMMNGTEMHTTYDSPYVARNPEFTITASLYTNATGSMKYTIDGKSNNENPINNGYTGNVTLSAKINLSTLNENNGKVHEAEFTYYTSTGVLTSAKFYFVVGNTLELTVPQKIDFGSHMYTDFLNGFSASPTVTGQLALFDGRNADGASTYSGNLGLSATATSFKDSAGDTLNADLYWGNALVPTNGSGVQIGEVAPPTSSAPAFNNFTQDIKDDLKLKSSANNFPKSGEYTCTLTWIVNDTLQ